jgi:hypothetical protein
MEPPMDRARADVVANPFFHRGPVRDPAYFFGRDRELARLADMLRQGQSVAVSGQRRLGKTSLIHILSHPAVAGAYGLAPDTTSWVLLDGGVLDGLGEEWLYGAVERALGGGDDTVPYARFVERLRDVASRGQRLIVVLDEFELVAANPLFGPALFNRLRGLAAQFPLQCVTVARLPLIDLTFAHAGTLSSPFFNIFASLRLPLFDAAAAADLLASLAARGGRPFDADLVAFLLGLAGPHPLFLQVAGYHAFAATGTLDLPALAVQVLADLDSHLRYYWSALGDEERYALAALPLLDGTPAIERLREAALVHGNNYLGAAVETFVRRQRVEGLLQGGPFLLDLRRGVVAVRGRPAHLTPTELAALKLFLERPGQILSPEQIEAALWPGETVLDPERARSVMKKLRAALGDAGDAIVNRRGQGYLLLLE